VYAAPVIWHRLTPRLDRAVVVAGVSASLLALAAPAAHAAKPASRLSAPAGYDISYPQCRVAYPSGQAFGIVGVNGGLANDANSCLGSELSWALASPGILSPPQPAGSLYINTADPGPAPGVTDWPTSGMTAGYGVCNASWSQACAFLYGQQRAQYSYGLVSAANPSAASAAPWWLDIETTNSWATSTTPNYSGLNIAAIQGFVAGLHGAGAIAAVGVYSTANQWSQITGLTPQTTAAAFGGASPPDWVAGTGTRKGAQSRCLSGGFTGATPTLAQYSSGGYDADLRCG
jgi:hypothetical protein